MIAGILFENESGYDSSLKIMAAGSSKMSGDEIIYMKLVIDIDKKIPVIFVDKEIDLTITSSSSRSVPVSLNIVNTQIDLTTTNTNQLLTTSIPVASSSTTTSTSASAAKDWEKSLASLPIFGLNEIEIHRKKSGKTPETAIIKTLNRGRRFKEERYISADSIFCKEKIDRLLFKCVCKASMKKEMRNVNVEIDKLSGEVICGQCTCPAGQSGYCNHVMALLFEIADYSLNGLKFIPEEIACTSRLCQWGIPGKKSAPKAPIMSTVIQKCPDKKGISSTLFEPRKDQHVMDTYKAIDTFKNKLANIDKRIGFACAIPPTPTWTEVRNTPHGNFIIGSPLACHLHPIGFDRTVKTNIETSEHGIVCSQVAQNIRLPLNFISKESKCIPDFSLTEREREYLLSLRKTEEEVRTLEKETTKQADCELWHSERKFKLTSSNAHKIYIRQRNFETLLAEIAGHRNELPKTVKDAMSHGKQYEPVARKLYENVLNYQLYRCCTVRETGCVIQPNLPWLLASPDGLVVDPDGIGLIEIKCPKSKANHTFDEMLSDKSFYIGKNNDGNLFLKKTHSYGYYSQIQMAMGLSCVQFCDFVVYTFTTMIIIRIPFDKEYFTNLVIKLNLYYDKYLLKYIVENI